jgi:hypothetical protein
MILDDPTKNGEASYVNCYATDDEYNRAVNDFVQHGNPTKRYVVRNGVSFRKGNIEHRFIRSNVTSSIIYYVAKKNGKDVEKLDELCQLYNEYVNSGNYGCRKSPHPDGGTGSNGLPTFRCLLISNRLLGDDVGLIANPPFPHGTPAYDSYKTHGHGWQRRGANGYLLVLAGLVAGLAFNPLRKALRKRWSFFDH